MCHVAHGVPPPAGLTPPEVEAVQAYVAGRWAGRMAAEPALGALAIGPFLDPAVTPPPPPPPYCCPYPSPYCSHSPSLEQLVADVDAALAAGAPRLQAPPRLPRQMH